MASDMRSEIRFSVRNLWNRVNMAMLSTVCLFEISHLSSFWAQCSEAGLWLVYARKNMRPELYIMMKARQRYWQNLKVIM